jgi:hypothetical protein
VASGLPELKRRDELPPFRSLARGKPFNMNRGIIN